MPSGRATGRPASPKPPSKSAPQPDKTTPAGTFSHAAADPAGANLLMGKVLGGCRIDGLLGRGAMGAVYKARQLKLDRDVAIKVIRPEMMADPRTLQRFEVEARTVGKFNSANVVMVHDIGFELGVHYLVMEFVQGKNLREHVKLLPHGRLPAGEALPLLRQACKGLDDARRLGVVHRDIKPDNLMLTEQGVLKIADFGIAKPLQDDFHMTLTSELIGTPLYMSPEQCHGGAEIDFRSDMYSLGATFFYLLTGEPPIRASSVYELIQTKTKLENLCLWKSLPELDENHPLSRVIERMTANDREDRYESYEQLLNDLVLVEAGATITLPPKRPKRPAQAGRDERRKQARVGAIAIAVLAVAAAGGGYALYRAIQPRAGQSEQAQAGPGVSPAPPGPSQPPERAPDAERAKQQLAKISGRLQQYGPDKTLADELAALPVPGELEPVRERLQRDLEAGQRVKERLAAIAIPTELKLPFDDLQQHLAAVERASKVDVASGDELIAWRTRAVMAKRAEGELGSLALARLSVAFNTWQSERRKAGNDKQRRAELAGDLDRIEAGRRRLGDLLPQQRIALDRDLPVAQLDAARRGLADDAAPPAADVDVAELLAQLQSEFDLDGPSAALRTRVDDLRPTRPEQAEQRSKLQNAIEVASNALNNARETRTSSLPSPPQPPFEDVVNYYGALDRALSPVRRVGGVLPGWASALRSELRAEVALGEAVRAACADAFAAWQQRRQAGATATELQSGAERLRTARQRAAELFPGLADRFAAAVPEATLAEQLTAAQRVGARQALIDAIGRLGRRLGDVRSLDAWALAAVDVDAELQRLVTDAAPFAGDDAIARALQATSDTRDHWRDATQTFGDAAGRLAAGNLTACATVLAAAGDGVEGRAELQRLGELAGGLRDAFDQFARTLEAANMRTALTAAARTAGSFTGLPKGVGDRIRGWQRGVDELAGKAAGMVPITSGSTTPALYFAASECTRGQFRTFQAELRAAAVGADDAQQFAAVAERVAGSGLTAGSLRALLNRQLAGDDGLPVERVSWNEAAAFAAWYGRALPTEAEWRLAAFGEPRQFEYPWGNDWPAKKEQFNGTDALVPAGDGGLSWRSQNGPPLHHLAGNVAEWLATSPDAREAQTAGGRYNLRALTEIKERASGRRLESRAKDDAIAGVGFRVVLRPRSVEALAWPQ